MSNKTVYLYTLPLCPKCRVLKKKFRKQIAAEENYDYDYIRELHGIALQNVKKLMPKSELPTQTHIL